MYLIKPIDENNDIMIYEFNFTLRDTSILTKSQFKTSKQCVDFNKTNNIYFLSWSTRNNCFTVSLYIFLDNDSFA
jgi:hypothetical protein